MKKLFFLLFLISIAFAQTRYYLPIPVLQSNGRPYRGSDVDLYNAGTTTKAYDLIYSGNSPGLYYSTTVITNAAYDVYVNGIKLQGYQNLQVIGSAIDATNAQLSVTAASDTTQLKLLTAANDSLGIMRYLDSLSTTNGNGGGWFIQVDSAYAENGIIAYDNATAGKQWVRLDYLGNDRVNVLWAGAKNDSSANAASDIDLVITNFDRIYIPSGKYRLDASVVVTNKEMIDIVLDDSALIYVNTSSLDKSKRSGFKLSAKDITVRGGIFKGYQSRVDADNQAEMTAARVEDQQLLFIYDSLMTNGIERILVENVRFENSGQYGLEIRSTKDATSNNIKSATVQNCVFIDNFGAFQGSSLGDSSGVLNFLNNYINDTTGPRLSLKVGSTFSTGGGVAIGVQGDWRVCNIMGNQVDSAGVMAIEVFSGAAASDSHYVGMANILNNYLGEGGHRTLSVVSGIANIENNRMQGDDRATELFVRKLTFKNNELNDIALHQVGFSDVVQNMKRGRQWVVENNLISHTTDMGGEAGIYFLGLNGFSIRNNVIIVTDSSNAIKTGPLRLDYCNDGVVENNQLYIRSVNYNFASYFTSSDCRNVFWKNNTVYVESAHSAINTGFLFEGNEYVKVTGNRFINSSSSEVTFSFGFVYPLMDAPADMYAHIYAGGAWRDSLITSFLLDTAATSTLGAYYLIGDNAVNDFAGKDRMLAKCTGTTPATFDFFTVDRFIYRPDSITNTTTSNKELVYWYTPELDLGATTDTLVSVTDGMFKCEFSDNDWSGSGSFAFAGDRIRPERGIIYQAVWGNNDRIRINLTPSGSGAFIQDWLYGSSNMPYAINAAGDSIRFIIIDHQDNAIDTTQWIGIQ